MDFIRMISGLSRGFAGVVGGWILGQIFSFPLAFVIDLIAREEVTGGRWPVTFPNIVWVCLTAVIAGFFAGWITGKRGKFVGALTQFAPLFVLTAFFILANIDPNEYFAKEYDSNPATWAWIGLLPAILGGHFGAKMGYKIFYYVVAGIGGLTMMV